MTDELAHHIEETNRKIEELNAFLADADADTPLIDPISKWNHDSISETIEAGAGISQQKSLIDMLSIPEYVDSRVHLTVPQILDRMEQLDEARRTQLDELQPPQSP